MSLLDLKTMNERLLAKVWEKTLAAMLERLTQNTRLFSYSCIDQAPFQLTSPLYIFYHSTSFGHKGHYG